MGPHELLSANDLTAVSHPYRTLANTIINLTYRNGPIEDIHAGRGTTFSLNHRRFTDRQARQVIRHTAESLSPFVSDFPLWDNYLTRLSPWPERVVSTLLVADENKFKNTTQTTVEKRLIGQSQNHHSYNPACFNSSSNAGNRGFWL